MKKNIYTLKKSKSCHGYTLIEIMLVLGIISVLVGAAIYSLVGNVDAARIKVAEGDIQSITAQLSGYEMLNRFLPTTDQGLQALVTRPSTEPVPVRWTQLLQKAPLDPWGNPYIYRRPGTHNSTRFDLFSLGPDMVESSDDIGNWQ